MNLTTVADFGALSCSPDVAETDRLRWLLLCTVACLYLPFVGSGPGSNPDSIRELSAGAQLLWQHRYVMSRPPGYFPYEMLCGVLYFFGGSIANNCASVLVSLMLLDSFLTICGRLQVPHRHLLAAMMAIHPIYWTASTSTIDYIWALACCFLGWRLMLNRRNISAGAMLGLAIGIRLASVLLVAPLLVSSLAPRLRDRNLWLTVALAGGLGAVWYLPAYMASGNSLAFLTYYIGSWSWSGQLARFIYKNVYFWGLPAALFILAMTPMIIGRLRRCDRKFRPLLALSLSISILIEGLFFNIPVQRAYLLPVLPFTLMLCGIAMRDRGHLLATMTLLLLSYNFVNVNFARADVPNHATFARLGVFIEPGYLLSDATRRLELRETHF